MWGIERRLQRIKAQGKSTETLRFVIPPLGALKVGNESEARWMPGEVDLIKGFTILLICPDNIP